MLANQEILTAVRAAAKAVWYAAHGRLDHDTCLSEAHEAVTLALRSYDPGKGSSLSTYSANRARWQARKLLRRTSKNASVPIEWFEYVQTRRTAPLKEMFEGLELQVVSLSSEYGYSYREIAARLGISYFRVNEIMKQVRQKLMAWDLGS